MSQFTHLTEQEITDGLAEVLKSPQDFGTLRAIVIRPGHEERRSLQECRLSPEGGTEGDAWARGCWLQLPDGSPDPDVQICIMNSRMIDLVACNETRWELAGDNLFVDLDLSRENLQAGELLSIGECVIEIAEQPHNGCSKFSQRFGAPALKVVNSPAGKQLRLRGVYAKVITAGKVRVGDLITKTNDARCSLWANLSPMSILSYTCDHLRTDTFHSRLWNGKLQRAAAVQRWGIPRGDSISL